MDRPPSSLLFIHASADLYGSDITLLQIVSGLDRDRFRAVVVVPYAGPLVPRLQEAGAEVLVYPGLPVVRRQCLRLTGLLRLTLSSLKTALWLAGVMRRRNVALVHNSTLAVALAGLAAGLARRPQLWHVQEIVTRPRVVASLLATISSVVSTVVVANSQATAGHYHRTRFTASAPVRVIPNGVDESRLRDRAGTASRSLVEASPEDTVFTLVGRINHLKGHAVFLDAAERIAAESENVRFLIVGDSFAGQEELTEAVDERIESSDLLRGRAIRLPHTAEIGNVYEASDVVVVPSTEPESFGLVAAEAMAAGLPVIASRIGALPEVVNDGSTGILVDPGDATSLLAAMRKLHLSPSGRVRMGRLGRERFERCFRVETYVEGFNRVYEELLRKERDYVFSNAGRG
ncbi:MAG TPA: glycosyltransferase family 4 protein [Rubrobacteraceae bacterium]|nr:glycosyltransferase family 4 protein [Rubrobacteraceae bacterium]